MKTYDLIKGLKQEYSKYTKEDFLVWETLFDRQIEQLQRVAHTNYLEGLEKIGFKASKIHDFEEVNATLAEMTGWEIIVVPGIINQKDFFQMLANKQFPSSTWLRSFKNLDYLSEPDMFHDAFGHIPLLTNQVFCDFYQKLGEIGVANIENPEIIEKLGRIYWFTVEFGLIKENNELKIYGAGILSSIGETEYSLSDKPLKLPFDVNKVMEQEFDNTVIQNTYFVIDSFEQLLSSVNDITANINQIINVN